MIRYIQTMKFYQKEGLSMTGGGCLPMIIQFAFLFGVIDVVYKPLTHVLHIGSAFGSTAYIGTFLDPINKHLEAAGQAIINNDYYSQIKLIDFMKTNPDVSKSLLGGVEGGTELIDKVSGFSLELFGLNLGTIPSQSGDAWWYWLIPILSAVTALIVGLISMKINQSDQMQGAGMMKGMMLIMPVISFFIAVGVPAGVGIYWTVSNIASLGQTILLKKMYNPAKFKDELALAQEQRKIEEKEKNTVYVESTVIEDGEEKVIKEEVILNKKEKERIAIKEARRRMAEKYGDALPEDEKEEIQTNNSSKKSKKNQVIKKEIITQKKDEKEDNFLK
ncbi:MAG: YidC/Oxa1 family membrane protein insertase [Oscillospiraceae bacterium]